MSVKHVETRFPYSYWRRTDGSCLRSNKVVTVISPFGDNPAKTPFTQAETDAIEQHEIEIGTSEPVALCTLGTPLEKLVDKQNRTVYLYPNGSRITVGRWLRRRHYADAKAIIEFIRGTGVCSVSYAKLVSGAARHNCAQGVIAPRAHSFGRTRSSRAG